jgi:hypothetical protein
MTVEDGDNYTPEPLKKLKVWEATLKGNAIIKGQELPLGVRLMVIADAFERAAELALDAGFLQAKEAKLVTLELVELKFVGPIYATELDVIESKGNA